MTDSCMDQARRYEDTVKKIRGVLACRVVTDARGRIEEIHVLAEDGRPAKHVLRDVESALIAGYGVTFDRRKVSIAQVCQEKMSSPTRLKLVRTEVIAEDSSLRVRVTLALGSHEVTGEASEETLDWVKAAAKACLAALETLTWPGTMIAPVDACTVRLKDRDIVLVAIMCRMENEETLLTGSCAVESDEREAAVRAVLDAVNPKLHLLLRS